MPEINYTTTRIADYDHGGNRGLFDSPQCLRRDGGKWPAITIEAAGEIGMKRYTLMKERFGISERTASKYNKKITLVAGAMEGRITIPSFAERHRTSPASSK